MKFLQNMRMLLGIDKSGVAAVEFALIIPLFLFLFGWTTDVALAFRQSLRISSAVSAASYYAFINGQSLDSSTASAFIDKTKDIVAQSIVNSDNLTISVLINNNADTSYASEYFCASSDLALMTTTGLMSTACGGGLMSGKFVTISVNGLLTPLFPSLNLFSSAFSVNQKVIVRVK